MRPGAVRFPWCLWGCGGVSVRYCGVRGVALCCPRRCVMRPGAVSVAFLCPWRVMPVSVALCPLALCWWRFSPWRVMLVSVAFLPSPCGVCVSALCGVCGSVRYLWCYNGAAICVVFLCLHGALWGDLCQRGCVASRHCLQNGSPRAVFLSLRLPCWHKVRVRGVREPVPQWRHLRL
jgi:hypothetical protein